MTRHHLHGSLGLGSLNFLVRLRFVNRRLIQYPRIIRGSRRFIGTRRFGGVVSRGKRRTRRIKTYQIVVETVDAWHVGTFAGRDERGTGRGRFHSIVRVAAFRSRRTSRDRSIPLSLLSTVYTDVIGSSDRELASSYLFGKKPSSLTNTGTTILWIDSISCSITRRKEILFRNRLIRTIFLHRFFLFYSLSVVIITP